MNKVCRVNGLLLVAVGRVRRSGRRSRPVAQARAGREVARAAAGHGPDGDTDSNDTGDDVGEVQIGEIRQLEDNRHNVGNEPY